MYIHHLFAETGNDNGNAELFVYPQLRCSNPKPSNPFISYNHGDIINQGIFTVNKKYPEYHFSNDSGSN